MYKRSLPCAPQWPSLTLHSSSSKSRIPNFPSIRSIQDWLSWKSMNNHSIFSRTYSSCSNLKTCCSKSKHNYKISEIFWQTITAQKHNFLGRWYASGKTSDCTELLLKLSFLANNPTKADHEKRFQHDGMMIQLRETLVHKSLSH